MFYDTRFHHSYFWEKEPGHYDTIPLSEKRIPSRALIVRGTSYITNFLGGHGSQSYRSDMLRSHKLQNAFIVNRLSSLSIFERNDYHGGRKKKWQQSLTYVATEQKGMRKVKIKIKGWAIGARERISIMKVSEKSRKRRCESVGKNISKRESNFNDKRWLECRYT